MTHATKCKTKDVNFAAGNVIPRECDCDGYHTFDELYDHRITLYIAFCKLWEETDFAETLEKAPEWDKHTSADVLERIKQL